MTAAAIIAGTQNCTQAPCSLNKVVYRLPIFNMLCKTTTMVFTMVFVNSSFSIPHSSTAIIQYLYQRLNKVRLFLPSLLVYHHAYNKAYRLY